MIWAILITHGTHGNPELGDVKERCEWDVSNKLMTP